MVTRADFYVGKDEGREWVGAIALDGYPGGEAAESVMVAATEAEFRELVRRLSAREDFTAPELGWPWPWKDGRLTDYAYAWDGREVWVSTYVEGDSDNKFWASAEQLGRRNENDEVLGAGLERCVWPDMSACQNVTLGKRSGVMILKG